MLHPKKHFFIITAYFSQNVQLMGHGIMYTYYCNRVAIGLIEIAKRPNTVTKQEKYAMYKCYCMMGI